MSTISVVGAGVGGLVSAAKLAAAGHDVTVYEYNTKENCGLEQVDSFDATAMDYAGIEIPDGWLSPGNELTFYPLDPDAEPLTLPCDENYRNITVDRKELFSYLYSLAEVEGVKFEFETLVTGPVILGGRVCGIETDKGRVYCDLVIDSAGMDSPVRTGLPDYMDIEKQAGHYDFLYSYRACIKRKPDFPDPEHRYKIYVNCDTGFTWIITEKDYVDVLIVDFNEIPYSVVADRLRFVSEKNPHMDKEMIRNGKFRKIPVRQPLPVFVADGYAALGDSAFMTYAAKGSGIAYSLKAATILADAVQKDENGIFDADTLWEYERTFFKEIGFDACRIALGKNLLPYMTAKEVNEIFTAKLISTEELYAVLTGSFQKHKIPVLVKDKLKLLGTLPDFRSKLMNLVAWIGKFALIETSLPAKYSRDDVRKWQEKYNSFFDSVKRNDIPEVEFNQLQ